MHCCRCNNDLAACTCPNLKERLDKLCECESIYIAPDYYKRIAKQAEKNAGEQTRQE